MKTRLCPPLTPVEAAALYGAFLRQILVPVAGARTLVYGWPSEGLDELSGYGTGLEVRGQRGGNLWERMEHCFEELFLSGHSPVLIRNTDSPDLPAERVAEALEAARPGKVVLGPDRGGGYYLVALAEPCPGLFSGLEEGAATVFEATRKRAVELGRQPVVLPVERDVDHYQDLLSLWRARGSG